jgi:crotonobetainyl-CoA:carnitine CoA-transferase CaiB-like acyl-CoA transferase
MITEALPLSGLRILEIGHFVAAPFCTRLLADLGADVIKIEPKTGDPVRQWGEQVDNQSLWWSVHGRNKRTITLNLKDHRAIDIVLSLVTNCDAVVENFRPGQLSKLGIGPDVMRQRNAGLIITHISGFGQSGPYRDRAAFGVIGESVGGLRYLTNAPPSDNNAAPVRVGVSVGDSLAGLYAAFGLAAALWQRDRDGGDGKPRTIDVALTESVLSLMEGMLPEYGRLGKVRQPTGGGIATAAPTNAYPTSEGAFVLIAANSEPLFAKLMTLVGRSDLIGAEGYAGNQARVRNAALLDDIIGRWSRQFDAETLMGMLTEADIPSSKVYTAADIAKDPQYLSRSMVREVPDDLVGGRVLHPGVVPQFDGAPVPIRWPGRAIGADTDDVLITLAGLNAAQLAEYRAQGVI